MTVYTKPTVLPAWAETATPTTDTQQPTNPQIQGGWPLTATPPSRQWFNWLLNWLANGVRYFMQRGLADWDVAETYAIGAVILGTDNFIYQSLVNANVGNVPATSPTKWGTPIFGAASGTFVGTLQGCTTGPTATINWSRVGNLVTIDMPGGLTGISNASNCSITGLPSALTPARTQTFASANIEDNGTVSPVGVLRVTTASAITLGLGVGGGTSFTASGTKGVFNGGFSLTYALT